MAVVNKSQMLHAICNSVISVTHIPSFQCSLCLETSTQPVGKDVGLVAGMIIEAPLGHETVNAFLRHLGITNEKTEVLVVVLSDIDSEVDSLAASDSDSEVP